MKIDIVMRVALLYAGAFYWYGVLSGYYAVRGPYTNDNPNVFILPAVGWASLLVLFDTSRKIIDWISKR